MTAAKRKKIATPPAPRTGWQHAAVFGGLFLLHALLASGMSAPTAVYDEFIFLGYGRFFAGASGLPDFSGSAFGAFGYGLLLAPAFLFAKSFASAYRVSLLLNAAMASSLYFLLYYLGRRIFDLPRYAAMAGAALCCLYPSFLLFSSYAISDNAFVPAFAAMAVLLAKLLERRGVGWAAGLGLSVGFMYALHGRGLGFFAVLAVVLAAAAALGMLRAREVAAALLPAGAAVVCTTMANKALLIRGWHGDAESGVGAVLRLPLIAAVLRAPAASLRDMALTLAGQFYYLAVASCGLALLGTAWFGFTLWDGRRKADARLFVAAFCALALAANLAISCVYITSIDIHSRPDFILLGRYMEGAMAVLLMAGFAFLFRCGTSREWRRRLAITAAAGVPFCAAFTVLALPKLAAGNWFVGPGPRINVLAWMGLLRISGSDRPAAAAVIALAAFVLACVWLPRRPSLAAGVLGALFVLCAWRELNTDLLPHLRTCTAAAVPGDALEYPSRLGPFLKALPAGHDVSYDMAVWHPLLYPWYQLWEPERRFVSFNSQAGGRPATAAVIAGKDWKAPGGAARLVACDATGDNCLFVPSL